MYERILILLPVLAAVGCGLGHRGSNPTASSTGAAASATGTTGSMPVPGSGAATSSTSSPGASSSAAAGSTTGSGPTTASSSTSGGDASTSTSSSTSTSTTGGASSSSGSGSTGTSLAGQGGACSGSLDCQGGAEGQSACVNYGGATPICEPYCSSDADCGNGCCAALDNGAHVCAPGSLCGSAPSDSSCSSSTDCAGGMQGTSSCVNFGGSEGALCEAYCQSDSDCTSGCCIPLQNGQNTCAPGSWCPGTDGDGPPGWLDQSHDDASVTLRIDSRGIKHLAYSDSDSSSPTVNYGECVSGCEQPANWKWLAVANHGVSGGYSRMELDPSGNPRIVFEYVDDDYLGDKPGSFFYAECNGGCADDAANWSVAQVATGDEETPFQMDESAYFALDPAGHPGFVFGSGSGAYYLSCQGSCTDAANWTQLQLESVDPGVAEWALSYTSTGAVRLARSVPTASACSGDDLLVYEWCDSSCSTDASAWQHTSLLCASTVNAFDLKVTSAGAPRLAVYNDNKDETEYWFCDGSCDLPGSWYLEPVLLPQYDGQNGVALQLDAQDNPLVITRSSTSDEIGFSQCTGNCSNGGTWAHQELETTGDLNQEEPVADPSTEWWAMAGVPTFVIDPDGSVSALWLDYEAVSASGQESDGPSWMRYVHVH